MKTAKKEQKNRDRQRGRDKERQTKINKQK